MRWRLYYIRLHYEREAAEAKALAAEEASEAKSTFLSTISHELRTPLTSIIGFTKLNKKNLEEKVLPRVDQQDGKTLRTIRKVNKNLDIVESEGQRLTNLINELLDLAKIEAGPDDKEVLIHASMEKDPSTSKAPPVLTISTR